MKNNKEIEDNKCRNCLHFDSMNMTLTVEGIPQITADGLCRKWNGAFTYGYFGTLPLEELCDEFKQF